MSIKKFTTLALAGLCAVSVFGQAPKGRKAVATTAQLENATRNIKNDMVLNAENASMLRAGVLSNNQPAISAAGKINAVSPVTIGSAGNAFTCLRTEQTQVYANDALDMVSFIHRNNQTVYGGSSGNLRYDVSIDGGTTFNNDIGVINPTLTFPARYPNGAIYNAAGNTNPLNATFVASAPALNGSAWDGHLDVTSSIVTSGTPTVACEAYNFIGSLNYLPGGLCEGMPGEFWVTDPEWNGSDINGPIKLYKSTLNTGTGCFDWVDGGTITPNHNLSYDGTPYIAGPNISFGPDGMTGWVAWLGDLVGGSDSVYMPVFCKTTDGGATWGTPVEFDLNSIPWIADSLQSLWVDSLGNPASTGRAACAFDYDISVDANGNPHLVVVVCSGSTSTNPAPQYSVYSGLAKFLIDATSPDGGATWNAKYISPILTFRTATFGATASTASMDNNPQSARSEDGNYIFFSWADSDTSLVTGNQTGVGFGESNNIAPNLRISSLEVATGGQTYPKLVSDGDLIWEGRVLFPTMAPTVLTNGNCWNLPIVVAEMPSNEPIDPTNFYYFGNDASICSGTFCQASEMTLGWDHWAYVANPTCNTPVGVNNTVNNNVVLGNAYPNPTADQSVITFELPAVTNVSMDLVNMYGQTVAVLANGEFAAGAHRVVANTEKLASGVYFYNLRTNGQTLSKKLVVTK
jgi:hypothetical protein